MGAGRMGDGRDNDKDLKVYFLATRVIMTAVSAAPSDSYFMSIPRVCIVTNLILKVTTE